MYEIGQKVRVVENADKSKEMIVWVDTMDKYIDSILTIADRNDNGNYKAVENRYWWHESWLAPIDDEPLKITIPLERFLK